MKPLHRKLLRDTWHLRGQLTAVALVTASGIAMFVALRSMHGHLLGAQARYYDDRRFARVFATVKNAPDALAGRIADIPGVAAVQTRIVADVLLDVPGLAEPAVGRLVSIPARRAPMLNDLYVRNGRWPEAGAGTEVLASAAFAGANGLGSGDSMGAVIHGRWRRLRISGTAISPEYVYEIRGGGDVFPDNTRFGVLWMEHEALAAAFDIQGGFNDVALALAPGASEAQVIDRLEQILAPYGNLGAYGREDHISHQFVSAEIAETQVTSILIPSIFLGVTAFLLHLVLSRLVGTQREQVAVLKAFGYSNAAIGRHYLELALLPVLAGSVLGAGLGLWLGAGLAEIYSRFYQFPETVFVPDPSIVAAGIGVGLSAAIAGSFGALRRVLALRPAEAMLPETPLRVGPGALEKTGIGRWLPPAWRIVVRHLDRRPMKAWLSVLAIALAFAIVVSGRYGYDAIDRMKEIQFDHVQREDVTVTFREPRSASVRHELSRLPGVMRVEPFRAVAVKLRSARLGHLVQRTSLFGLVSDARLRRIVDGSFRVHAVPADGILLTDRLAEQLSVRSGDRIVVEVLEGRRPVFEARVSGLVGELIGSVAYVEIGAANRMADEGAVDSGAFLAVDPVARDALYARLKRLPGVAAVAVREAALSSFEKTIGESFLTSIVMILVFASIIAGGVVYNGARIALSERGRELASLRVLGFRRREVAAMLLGEQALLTVVAIPLGSVIGYGICALIVWRFESELFRIPMVVSRTTLAFAVLVVGASALISGLVVRHRIDRLDLVAVLKTRE